MLNDIYIILLVTCRHLAGTAVDLGNDAEFGIIAISGCSVS